MDELEQLFNHDLIKEVLKDGEAIAKGREVNIFALTFDTDPEFNEFEFYIHNVGYVLSQLLTWCKQLQHAVVLLSNFDYSAKNKINRQEHFFYNIENYFIRLQSLYDRLLQLANSIFHICIEPSNITHEIIVSNFRVKRTNVPSKLKPIKKALREHIEKRNTIVHRESYRDEKLRRLDVCYGIEPFAPYPILDEGNIDSRFKRHRALLLKNSLKTKKEEFENTNRHVFNLTIHLFDEMLENYQKQKIRLRKIVA